MMVIYVLFVWALIQSVNSAPGNDSGLAGHFPKCRTGFPPPEIKIALDDAMEKALATKGDTGEGGTGGEGEGTIYFKHAATNPRGDHIVYGAGFTSDQAKARIQIAAAIHQESGPNADFYRIQLRTQAPMPVSVGICVKDESVFVEALQQSGKPFAIYDILLPTEKIVNCMRASKSYIDHDGWAVMPLIAKRSCIEE